MKLVRGKDTDEIRQLRLVKAYEFIAVNTTRVLQPVIHPDRNLCRKPIMYAVDRGADDRGEARIDYHLSTDHYEKPVTLRIARRMGDTVQFAAPHSAT